MNIAFRLFTVFASEPRSIADGKKLLAIKLILNAGIQEVHYYGNSNCINRSEAGSVYFKNNYVYEFMYILCSSPLKLYLYSVQCV